MKIIETDGGEIIAEIIGGNLTLDAALELAGYWIDEDGLWTCGDGVQWSANDLSFIP